MMHLPESIDSNSDKETDSDRNGGAIKLDKIQTPQTKGSKLPTAEPPIDRSKSSIKKNAGV